MVRLLILFLNSMVRIVRWCLRAHSPSERFTSPALAQRDIITAAIVCIADAVAHVQGRLDVHCNASSAGSCCVSFFGYMKRSAVDAQRPLDVSRLFTPKIEGWYVVVNSRGTVRRTPTEPTVTAS